MPLFVERPVDRLHDRSRRVLFDLSAGPEVVGDKPTQMISVIGCIRHHMPDAFQPFDQAARLRAVTPLTGRDRDADRQAKRVNRCVDLRRQAAFGATDRVSLNPPFCAACIGMGFADGGIYEDAFEVGLLA